MTEIKERKKEIVFLAAIGIFIFLWAVIQPLNASPDETMRYDICQYIYENHSLPHGGDPAIRNEIWGYSYAFFPILSYLAGALLMAAASLFTHEPFVLLMAARMVSVLCGIGMAWFVLRIGDKIWKDKIYKWLFTCLAVLLPQSIFVFTYVNNDSLALFSTAMIIYYWICGCETRWSYKSCLGLAIGIILCALSYYNAYGVILASIILFGGSLLKQWKDKRERMELLKKGLLIALLVLIGISWWFIRSYLLYDGDFLGLATSEQYSELYGMEGIKPSSRQIPYQTGTSLLWMLFQQGWIKVTMLSFVGCFGYMELPLKLWMYLIYAGLVVIGLIGLFWKKRNNQGQLSILFHVSMMLTAVIPNLLNVLHSYLVDFEPQGRYSMPMLVPLMYFTVLGWQFIENRLKRTENYHRFLQAVIGVLLLLPVVIYLFIFFPFYR